MTREEFINRVDDIMCGTSNAERAYLEQLYYDVTAPQWRSVEDELPPYEKSVLVCDNNHPNFGPFITHRDCNNPYKDENNFVIGVNLKATHWMPLPSPPKKGGEK